MELKMEKISLSLNLVNAVMQYLGTKPFQEVFQLVQAIQQESQGQLQTGVEQAEAKPTE
jgi:hypothetical protein